MRVINMRKSPLTRWALLCIVLLSASTVWGQEGGSGGGDDGKPRMQVMVNADQLPSADLAVFLLDGQLWRPRIAKDDNNTIHGEAGTQSFQVRSGFSGPFSLFPIEAIDPDDGTVSLEWNIWSEDPVLLNGVVHRLASPIHGKSGTVQAQSWSVDVPTFKGILTPEDNFTGRSLSKYGVGEVVLLSMTTDSEISIAGHVFFWELAPGSQGTLSSGDFQGNAVYTAPAVPCEVELVLKYTDSAGVSHIIESYTLHIIEPSGAYMVQKPGSNIKHIHDFWRVGFLGYIFLLPTDVSFKNIQFREGSVAAVATGWLAYRNGMIHPTGNPIPVSQGNSTTGCQVLGQDQVWSGPKAPPFGDGTFEWPIPWEYRVNNSAWAVFTTAHHHVDALAQGGEAIIQKIGAGPFSRLAADPTSDY